MQSPQDIRDLKQVTDTLVFTLDPLPESTRKEPVLIPYKHFPSSIELSEIQKILHHIFSLCELKVTKADETGFWFDFSSPQVVEKFYSYKASINKQYNQLPKDEPHKEAVEHFLKSEKLYYFPDSGEAKYKDEVARFSEGTKGRALLDFFTENPHSPFNTEEIQKNCNHRVANEAHLFRGEKDIDDTISQIRSKLKVKKRSRFPLRKNVKNRIPNWKLYQE